MPLIKDDKGKSCNFKIERIFKKNNYYFNKGIKYNVFVCNGSIKYSYCRNFSKTIVYNKCGEICCEKHICVIPLIYFYL